MLKAESKHQPCPCGKSSDAFTINEDGSGKCFSCGKFFPSKGPQIDTSNHSFQYIEWRGVNKYIMQKYRTATSVDQNGNPTSIGFRYPSGAVKVRSLANKAFKFVGENTGEAVLFGADIFPKGGKEIIITEGELDAMSAHQMTNIPAVSIKDGAPSAFQNLKQNLDYLLSFDKVYLCFDNDEPGKKATKACVPLFPHSKLYILKLTFKDANEYLEKDPEAFLVALKNAKKYTPDNIKSSFSELEESLEGSLGTPIGTFPFKRLQDMTYGLYEGHLVLFKAMEGIGKTEVLRAIEAHILQTTDHNIGVIHLEENQARTIKGFASYALGKACHLPNAFVTNQEIMEGFKALVKRDERVHIYSHFGSDNPTHILNSIRFLVAACNCKFIFLDHISILVSGTEQDDERQKLDFISTQLKMLAEELKFCLVFISHINDDGKTRGSRNISKIADVVIKLDRNLVAEKEEDRNTTYLTVEKNRWAANTGPAGKLMFNPVSYQVRDAA